jgi:6-pyruvoyltetrahydropterin/6-carboxytetrahydropterin synthase
MKWVIDKRIDGISYGHRVWTQNLNSEYSIDNCAACRHVHGHNASIHIFLEGTELQDGFVTDFKHLNWVKKFLDDIFDHKFVIDCHDPLYDMLVTDRVKEALSLQPNINIPLVNITSPGGIKFVGRRFDVSGMTDGPMKEYIEGILVVDFVPTSENLSKWIFDFVQEKMGRIGVTVSKIDFFETDKSRSSFQR